MNNLVNEIKNYLAEKGISDGKFTRDMKLDQSTWSYIKSGKHKPGVKFLSAVASNYPELQMTVFQYMAERGKR